jgi:pyruvate formate lyase activating enzyme
MLGRVFRIQRFSIHDGYGIRTTVFLKGCPLRCVWCHNPESQNFEKELGYVSEKCVYCLKCVEVCEMKAIKPEQSGMVEIDRRKCNLCGKCVEVCRGKALEIFGFDINAEEVVKIVERDRVFYKHSGGGATFSGGEPYYQPEFLFSLLFLCKERGINTAVDTSGYTSWKTISESIDLVDLFLYDLKDYDTERHRATTGAGNELIVSNLRKIVEVMGPSPIVVRIPFIPGSNFNTKEDFNGFLKVLAYVGANKVDVLPYHSLARDKYRWLDRKFRDFGKSGLEQFSDEFVEFLKEHGFKVTKGGYF